jgi:hypothetical protein
MLTSDGMKTLRKGRWRLLKTLSLSENELSHTAFEHLANNQWRLISWIHIRSKRYINQQVNFDVERQLYTAIAAALLRFDNPRLTLFSPYPRTYDNYQDSVEDMLVRKGALHIV